jgi:hypothetical protein
VFDASIKYGVTQTYRHSDAYYEAGVCLNGGMEKISSMLLAASLRFRNAARVFVYHDTTVDLVVALRGAYVFLLYVRRDGRDRAPAINT